MTARTRLIAELGSVHDGSFGNACRLIEAAAECGADAAKLQTHIAEAETLADAPSPSYFSAEPRFDYFRRTAFDLEQWRELIELSRSVGIELISSPFSIEAVDLLEAAGLTRYKIASGEVTNLPLLERVAETQKPVLLSSGMSNWAELGTAVEMLAGVESLTILQCSSAYPCPPERVGLNVIAEMRERFDRPVGFSDHTTGLAAAISAAVLGACVIEKHFTFSRRMYGSDAALATEPREFEQLARELAAVCAMLENPVDKNDLGPYLEMKRVFEKSVVTAGHIPAGTTLTRSHLAFKKPGSGISAAAWQSVVGRRTLHDLPPDHLICSEDLA